MKPIQGRNNNMPAPLYPNRSIYQPPLDLPTERASGMHRGGIPSGGGLLASRSKEHPGHVGLPVKGTRACAS